MVNQLKNPEKFGKTQVQRIWQIALEITFRMSQILIAAPNQPPVTPTKSNLITFIHKFLRKNRQKKENF